MGSILSKKSNSKTIIISMESYDRMLINECLSTLASNKMKKINRVLDSEFYKTNFNNQHRIIFHEGNTIVVELITRSATCNGTLHININKIK